jgi:hypothetical protein
MSELKIKKGRDVRKADFEEFDKDLKLFLEAFSPQILSKWVGKNKGNLSRKLNGNKSITRKDLRDFYGSVGSVVAKLKKGISPYQIELEMATPVIEDPESYKKNLWEEIRLIKETLEEHGTAIQELKSGIKGSQETGGPQNS